MRSLVTRVCVTTILHVDWRHTLYGSVSSGHMYSNTAVHTEVKLTGVQLGSVQFMRCVQAFMLAFTADNLGSVRKSSIIYLQTRRTSCRQALHEPCQPTHSASSPTIRLPTVPLYRDSGTQRPQRRSSCSRRLPCLSASILLDLSAAFDTVDHQVLLCVLSDRFDISGTALNWFESYLSDRTQSFVHIGHTTAYFPVTCSVPRGVRVWTLGFHRLH